MSQLNLEHDSKVVRISAENFNKITSEAKFGMSFDEALSKYLKEVDKV